MDQHDWLPYEKRHRCRHTRRKPSGNKGREWNDASSSQEHKGLLATTKSCVRQRILPLSLWREYIALLKPWFWNSSFQDSKKVNSVVLSHPVCDTLLKWPLEANIFTKAFFFFNPHLELCGVLLHQLLERGSHTFREGASAASEGALWNGNGW